MNAHLKILTAAAVTVGTMSLGYAQDTATESENQVQSAADRTGDSAERAGDRTGRAVDSALEGRGVHGTAQAPDAEGIRDVLASTTEATLKGRFSDVVERFVDADRNRLGKDMPTEQELASLTQLQEQFRNDWQAKYNQEFDIEKEELVFNPSVKIHQGEFQAQPDRARTAGERSDATDEPDEVIDRNTTEGDTAVGRTLDRTGDALGQAADETGDAVTAGVGQARDAVTGNADANREPGRNKATVMIPASHGLPAVSVPLIHELPDQWKIDIPDKLDAATLQANLQKHLSQAQQQKAQWPADANEAYLNIAHHVMLAIFEGTPHVQQKGATETDSSAQPAGSATPPTVSPSAPPATPAQPTPGQAQ